MCPTTDRIEPTFEYLLEPLDDEAIEKKAEVLAAVIGDHASKHDFAQRILVDQIVVRPVPSGQSRAISIPFRREHYREMPAIGMYLRQRGRDLRLKLCALVLPGGESIPM
jgi:hypothetical protein